jgi:polyhydroxybutyrate depolymerase
MKSKKQYLLPVILLVLLTLTCSRSGAVDSTKPAELPIGESSNTLSHDGRERSYLLYVPGSMDWNQAIPVVFVFHGGTGNAESAIRMSGFNQVADQHGFIVVYPNGTGRVSDEKLLTWNGGACCGYAQEMDVDDVGFVRAIVNHLESLVNIDGERIYAAGMSNGGMLSHRLGCEASDLFAAIGPVAGTLNLESCQPAEPISVIEFHGTDDQHVLYEGGNGPKALANVDFRSVQDSIQFWVSANGCVSGPQVDTFDDIQHETWQNCDGPVAVELYTIIGGGHSWPGGQSGWEGANQPTQTISASQLIWEFFQAHPKPD